ncbi:MAG TPA: SBBP repeat-containing protein [Chthoniobacterales bacterium]|nr:SBBP repeat-containing protein [Chthoniobacterales bacterium]
MNKKKAIKKIGASFIVTLGLIGLTYVLLPNGDSIGAAPKISPPASTQKAMAAAARVDQKRARMALGQLPLSFEINRGQFPAEVQFASRGAGVKAFFTQSETVFVLKKPGVASASNAPTVAAKGAAGAAQILRERQERAAQRAASRAVVRMSLVGANMVPAVTGMESLPGKINYFRGNDEQKWITDVPTFRKVSYAAVYPGIDLVYYGKGGQLEYDLVIAPGADPNQIAFNFEGAERLEVDAATGALVVHAAGGAQMRQGQPLIYQQVDGVKRAVSGGFTANGSRAGFSVGEYDHSRPLVIDPAIILYSTYLAGEEKDRVHDIAADADGDAYAVGWTDSELFPTKNAYQPGENFDTEEAFITKFNPDGSELIWSTYLGGGDTVDAPPSEGAYGVTLDSDRNVYVTGWTFSADFPTRNAMQTHLADACCESDSFITKMNAAGDQLIFSTYFGGASGTDVGRGIALDSHNNVYVVGYTDSFAFPTTNPIPGNSEIDRRGSHIHNGQENFDGYLAKIDASGQFRVYSTYIGGDLDDVALGVKVDHDGNAYVTGWTDSTEPTPVPSATPSSSPIPSPTPASSRFPTTDLAVQKDPGGTGFSRDAFVAKVSPTGSEYIYSTFLGGAATDVAWGIALGTDSSAYLTGYTDSGGVLMAQSAGNGLITTQDDFPTTANAFQPQNNGGFDAFLTRINPDGSAFIYSTYIGGDANEGDGGNLSCTCDHSKYDGAAVAVDLLGNAYITGWTESTFVPAPPGDGPNGPQQVPLNFPTKDAFQPEPGSNPGSSPPQSRDAFVAMFNTSPGVSSSNSLVYSSFLGGSHQDEGEAITVDPGGNLYVAGWTASDSDCSQTATEPCFGPAIVTTNDFPTTKGAFQEFPSTDDDGWVVAFVGGTSTVIGQGQGFTIFGQVTLADDGSPVEGVTITLTKPDSTTATTTTDAMGTYQFTNLKPVPEAPYTVTPSGLGYEYNPSSSQVTITNKNERADFTASFPEPEPSPSTTPTATATATATPTVPPTSQALNLSTRLHVLTGDQVGIGGFIITGSVPKHVIVRAIGPSLTRFGIPNPLPDPILELHGTGSFQTITNDNWRDTQEAQIKASGIPPTNDVESAIDITLPPGNYTAVIFGKGGSTGIGLIEVYDLDSAAVSKLGNISTRGFVGSTPGDSVIAGFILGNSNNADHIVIRGLGPSLASLGVPNTLQNPTLELHNGDGVLLFTNNDWQDNPSNAAQVAAAGLAPSDTREAAIAVILPPGAYSAILAGLGNTTGNGLVEIYDRGNGP